MGLGIWVVHDILPINKFAKIVHILEIYSLNILSFYSRFSTTHIFVFKYIQKNISESDLLNA